MDYMMKSDRVNYYQSIHKTLRRLLFLFSIELGAADMTCDAQVHSLIQQYKKVKVYLEDHAMHEDTYFHPFIQKHIPKECEDLEREHQAQDSVLQRISTLFDDVLKEKSPLQRQNLGWSLYLMVNQFIAGYLQHLEQEEAQIMPALWQKCDDKTLLEPMQVFIQSMTKEEFLSSKNDFLPAISPQEKALIFGSV